MNQEPTQKNERTLAVKLTSFGYKNGAAPTANLTLDVRFLKNPYWEESLRPLTGLDKRVRDYVVEQKLAKDVLSSLMQLVSHALPGILSVKADTFTIALGCTGGQHRSCAMVEELAQRIREEYPQYKILVEHRELAGKSVKVGKS